MAQRPIKCRFPDKSWLTRNQAIRKANEYGMEAYRCYDHWHIGGRVRSKRAS